MGDSGPKRGRRQGRREGTRVEGQDTETRHQLSSPNLHEEREKIKGYEPQDGDGDDGDDGDNYHGDDGDGSLVLKKDVKCNSWPR